MVIEPEGPTSITGRVFALLVGMSVPTRVPNVAVPNNAAGAASQIVTSSASPTPTRVPTGTASPRLAAKLPSTCPTLVRRARSSVISITRRPFSEVVAGAFSIAPRDGPTQVEQALIIVGRAASTRSLDRRVRGVGRALNVLNKRLIPPKMPRGRPL